MGVCVAVNLKNDFGQIDGQKSWRETKPTQSERETGGEREKCGFLYPFLSTLPLIHPVR